MMTGRNQEEGPIRPLSSFTLPEQRVILALVRLEDSPAIPAAPASSPRRARGTPRKERKPDTT